MSLSSKTRLDVARLAGGISEGNDDGAQPSPNGLDEEGNNPVIKRTLLGAPIAAGGLAAFAASAPLATLIAAQVNTVKKDLGDEINAMRQENAWMKKALEALLAQQGVKVGAE